ncbi:MAG: triphosphoribosyl-dephospho-CoA synthase [Candidatus Bathyarchaeota archaeon]|nr:triphosphoribosyl-dephospho-CoA synthase [Candidatus Bathyarchaeota archaeon]
MRTLYSETSKLVANCASLAALLEVSAYPKPGNIHRLNDFPDTSYEHFLAGSVALGSIMGELAARSYADENYEDIRLGESILDAVNEMFTWQHGGNTHLGVALLYAPISAGAGKWRKTNSKDVNELRNLIRKVIESATQTDSITIYQAIEKAMPPKNLGEAEKLDIKNKESVKNIQDEKITPLQIFQLCKDRDQICHEWVTGFETVFETGYPYLKKRIDDGASVNSAIVDTFLHILSTNHDSLIIRKKGVYEAEKVSKRAKRILEYGGIDSEEGKRQLWMFDEELKKEDGGLNPGTTADITAASVFVLLLSGWRP